jgi:hypothetical protein
VLVAAVIWTFVAPVIIDAVGPIVHPTWRDAVVGLTLLASFAAAAYWVLAYFVYGLIDQSTIAGQDPHSRTASAAPSATATPRRARWSVVLVGADDDDAPLPLSRSRRPAGRPRCRRRLRHLADRYRRIRMGVTIG